MDFAFASKTTFAAASSFTALFSLYSISQTSQYFSEKKSQSSYFWSTSSSSSSTSTSTENQNQMLSRRSGVNRLGFARVGAYCIPATGKTSPTGEDGFFISSNGRSLGVADGVGGWAEQGIDPSIFTRRFMKYALEEVTTNSDAISKESEYNSSIGIMQKAFDRVMKDKLLGSCAAIFCSLEDKAPVMNQKLALGEGIESELQTKKQRKRMMDIPTGPFATLNIASVGDCGVAVIRGGMGVVYASREQQRSFNFPFQLGPEGDCPASALISDFTVAAGDVVVLGSDGLFDNVYPEMLPAVVRNEWRKSLPKDFDAASGKITIGDLPPLNCHSLAEAISKMAYQGSRDREHLSPFSLRAKMGGVGYEGGKPDDITVVVGQILDIGGSADENKGGGVSNKIFKLETPEYQLIEDFFKKYPLSEVQKSLSKL